jgi:hypothetical protein
VVAREIEAMTELVAIPLWQLLTMVTSIVLVVAPAIGIPSAVFGARYGAKMAIQVCSQHWDCNMTKASERVGWTKQLKRQHDELMREHPDALAIRRAAEDVDRAEQPKVDTRIRAQQDVDNDGHKG